MNTPLSNTFNRKKAVLLSAFFIFVFASCSRLDLYEKVVDVPGQKWSGSYQPSFAFNITDTSAPYQLFLILRHNNKYNYNNIWINLYRTTPDGKTSKVPYELRLATNDRGWLAEGMDDIYEHRILLSPPANDSFYFNRPGTYKFSVEQIMREDPLQNVLNVGLRLEKKK